MEKLKIPTTPPPISFGRLPEAPKPPVPDTIYTVSAYREMLVAARYRPSRNVILLTLEAVLTKLDAASDAASTVRAIREAVNTTALYPPSGRFPGPGAKPPTNDE